MNTRKRLTAALPVLALLLSFAGCGLSGAPGTTTEETLHNGYLGLTVNLPAGWIAHEINRKNLTAEPGESDSLDKLELKPYKEGGSYVALLSLENGAKREDESHITMSLYAERYSGGEFASLEEYVYATELTVTGELEDGSAGELLTKETALLSDTRFTRLIVRVTPEEENLTPFLEDYYITKLGDLYLVAYLNHWEGADNMEAAHAALESLVTLTGEKEDRVTGAATETTYYNGYLGISATVPVGKYTKTVNPINFTLTRMDSEKLEELEMGSYNDGGYYIDLMTLRFDLGGQEESYAELDLYAESYPDFDDVEAYLDAMEKAFVSGEMTSIRRTLEKREAVTINGKESYRITMTAADPDTGASRTEEHYVTEIRDLYVILYISYDGEESARAAREMFELVKF